MSLTNNIVIAEAKKLGFDLVGFSSAVELNIETQKLKEWLDKGLHAGMSYLERNIDKRKDIKLILPEAESVISLGSNYYVDEPFPGNAGSGKVSRYAWGKDYHNILWEKLDQLTCSLKNIDPTFEALSYVDTGPVMDKIWAKKAGLGWMGKHSNIINRNFGSWFFISTLITNKKFDESVPVDDLCGKCTACIDACPTNAILQDYVVDANKCISYQTIENKGEIDSSLKGRFDNWIFGCDTCQDVCPWNIKFSVNTKDPEFTAETNNKELMFEEINKMTDLEFKQRFNQSPIKRAKLKGLKRNAEFILGK